MLMTPKIWSVVLVVGLLTAIVTIRAAAADRDNSASKHWAFQKPHKPVVPDISDSSRQIRNPIDSFVVAKLQKENLRLSRETERWTLVRRLSLDLTGLPPSSPEVDAFVKDDSEDAYERLVDRLLASPHYGERMAQDWLDL